MKELITVIMPVYNVEKYIERCIESVLQQTYSNLELILVDDGSIDRSGQICDEYKEKDKRVIVIHKENGGVSSARNIALTVAKGEYIYFCDPDDYLEVGLLEKLLNSVKEEETDFAVCAYVRDIYEDEILKQNENKTLDLLEDRDNLPTVLVELHKNTLLFMPWNKLFKRSIINKYDIVFPQMKRFEDTIFIYTYLKYVRSLSFIDVPLYHYSIFKAGTETATTKFNDQLYECYYECYMRGIELVNAYSTSEYIKSSALDSLQKRMETHFFVSLCGDIVVNLSRSKKGYLYRRKYVKERLNRWKSFGILEEESWFSGRIDKLVCRLVKYQQVDLLTIISFIYSHKYSKCF